MAGESAKNHEVVGLLIRGMIRYERSIQAVIDLSEFADQEAVRLDSRTRTDALMQEAVEAVEVEKQAKFLYLIRATMPLVFSVKFGLVGKSFRAREDSRDGWESIEADAILPASMPDDIRKDFVAGGEMPEGCKIVKSDSSYRVEIDDPELSVAYGRLLDRLENSSQVPRHSQILKRSMLITAVSSFEELVADIYAGFLRVNPGALNSSDLSFSLKEIQEFSSINDAIESAIAHEVEDFSRRGFSGWQKWFDGRPLGIDFRQLVEPWGALKEVVERRNIIVHRSSVVSKQYLANVPVEFREGVEEGDLLEVGSEYLQDAFDYLLSLGVNLNLAVISKLFDRHAVEAAFGDVIDFQYELLQKGRNVAVIQLGRAAEAADLPASTSNIFAINTWIARHDGGEVEVVRSEVEKWDVSALSDRFKLAKLVLLEQDEAALHLIDKLRSSRDLSESEIAEWPLLKRLRDSGDLTASVSEFVKSASGNDA